VQVGGEATCCTDVAKRRQGGGGGGKGAEAEEVALEVNKAPSSYHAATMQLPTHLAGAERAAAS
jgi:hypothetical protein